ncbi:MAG: hypothetical protein K2F91_03845 [Muribaculaceae bacterium]|nr:hypothetical protein [Muribaculaceae bacterium]
MKKLVLMLAVVFSMSFFACGNKEQAAEAEAPATEEVVVAPVEEEVAVVEDSVLNDSTVEVAAAAADVVAE